jgi:hypothetical protein
MPEPSSPDDGTTRDRDRRGRPRNARPRDALGRPGPRGAPPDQGGSSDPPALGPRATVVEAQRLLDLGLAFRAHEVLEAQWKASAGPQRELWRALAQLAVGITHRQRGNQVGSARLLQRAHDNLEPWAGRRPHGLDIDGLRSWARQQAQATSPAGWNTPRLAQAADERDSANSVNRSR